MAFNNQQWDLEEELKKLARKRGAIYMVVITVAIVALVIWLGASSVYTVAANERALVLRFGKEHAMEGPGLHFKLPFGIDKALKTQVKEKKRQEFGFRTQQAGVETTYAMEAPTFREEARMLTGDLNILMVPWVVRYRIRDIRKYYFNIRSPETTIRDVSEAVVRTVVGDRSVDEVLTIGRAEIQSAVKAKMQEKLDAYESGILVVDVRLKDVSPPDAVKDAFNAVNKARQQKEKIINEAKAQRNSKIPEARGRKKRVIAEAEGYKKKRVNEAEGDAGRFEKILAAYRLDPEVMRRRLYLETMRDVLSRVETKYVLEAGEGNVLKLLNLTDLERKGGRR